MRSQPFIVGLGAGGGVAVLLFILFLVLVSYMVCRFKRSDKVTLPPGRSGM